MEGGTASALWHHCDPHILVLGPWSFVHVQLNHILMLPTSTTNPNCKLHSHVIPYPHTPPHTTHPTYTSFIWFPWLWVKTLVATVNIKTADHIQQRMFISPNNGISMYFVVLIHPTRMVERNGAPNLDGLSEFIIIFPIHPIPGPSVPYEAYSLVAWMHSGAHLYR